MVLTLASIGGAVGLWYALIRIFDMPAYVLPYPHDVGVEIADRGPLLWQHTLTTLREILTGFSIATALGILIGIVIASSKIIGRVLYPLLVISQSIPKVALAPLFLAWFGFGLTTNIAITVLIAIFPVIVNTALGVQSVDIDLLRLGRSMGGSRFGVFVRIKMPSALPTIFAGLKLAMTFSAVGAVIGEFVAGSEGLGYLVQSASGRLDTEFSIAAITVLSALAVLLFRAIELAERVLLRGYPSYEAAIATT